MSKSRKKKQWVEKWKGKKKRRIEEQPNAQSLSKPHDNYVRIVRGRCLAATQAGRKRKMIAAQMRPVWRPLMR
jgi:hypothetical protein